MKVMSRRARPHTVTLYNYLSTTAGVASYQRTQLERVRYDSAYQQRLAKRGVATQDKVQLFIELRDVQATADRSYVQPKIWAGLTAQQRAAHFTLDVTHDFLVEDACSTEVPPGSKAGLQQGHDIIGITDVATLGGYVLEVYGK